MSRILILTHEFAPFRGGIAAVAQGLAAGAATIGHEPVVLAPDYHRPARELESPSDYEVIRFPGATCPIVSARRLTRFAVQCRRTIQQVKPDIVHAADPPAQMALTVLSRLQLIRRYYFTVHGTEALRYRDELFPRIWMWRAFTRVTGVAAVSNHVLRLCIDDLGLLSERALVAHPAIAQGWHDAPLANRTAVREKWGASASDVVLLTVGRVVPEKGHSDVIEALSRLPDAVRVRAVYVVAGKASAAYASALSAAASTAGVRLILMGEVPDAAAIEAADAADVFVMASRQTATRLEGFGIAYIEAGARGLPSVARATGGVEDAVRNGVTGLVTPEHADAETLGSTLRLLIEDGERRKQLGRAAQQVARQFTWKRHAQTVYDAFLEWPIRVAGAHLIVGREDS